jgi:tartrate dehydrogenase/decarboxylase/D-malate dehydrogenase
VPDHVSLWGLLIPIRRAFRQYVNLRPVKLLRGMTSPLRGVEAIDMLVVRENSEGEYSEMGGRFGRGTPGEFAVQESVFTRVGVERVTRYALDLAQSRSGRLASATKSNGIIHTMPFWDEVVREQVAARPGVELSEYHVDALAAMFVLDPGPLRRRRRVQPVRRHPHRHRRGGDGQHRHRAERQPQPRGRVPVDVRAGPRLRARHRRQGRANPLGQVWSAAMMLDHLEHAEAAAQVVAPWSPCSPTAASRTGDLGGTATTDEVTTELLGRCASRDPTGGAALRPDAHLEPVPALPARRRPAAASSPGRARRCRPRGGTGCRATGTRGSRRRARPRRAVRPSAAGAAERRDRPAGADEDDRLALHVGGVRLALDDVGRCRASSQSRGLLLLVGVAADADALGVRQVAAEVAADREARPVPDQRERPARGRRRHGGVPASSPA